MFSSTIKTGLLNPPGVKHRRSSQTNVIKRIILGWTKFLIYVSWLHILSNIDNLHILLDYRLHGLYGSHGSHILILSCYFTGLTLCSMSTIHQSYLLTMVISCFFRMIAFIKYFLWLFFFLSGWRLQNIIFFLPIDIFQVQIALLWY